MPPTTAQCARYGDSYVPRMRAQVTLRDAPTAAGVPVAHVNAVSSNPPDVFFSTNLMMPACQPPERTILFDAYLSTTMLSALRFASTCVVPRYRTVGHARAATRAISDAAREVSAIVMGCRRTTPLTLDASGQLR